MTIRHAKFWTVCNFFKFFDEVLAHTEEQYNNLLITKASISDIKVFLSKYITIETLLCYLELHAKRSSYISMDNSLSWVIQFLSWHPWAAVRVFERLFSLPIPGQLVSLLLQSQSQLLQSPLPYWCRHIRGSCESSSSPYENPWSPVPYRLPTLYSYSASRTVVRRRGLSAALTCFGGGVRVPSNPSLQRRWSVVVWRGNVLGTAIIHTVTRLRNSLILKCM